MKDIPCGVCSLAYNMSFEKTVIARLAEIFPDLSERLMNIHANMHDLMIPFYEQSYYTAAMQGSYSIKYVLPALYPNDPELDYHNLEGVHNGSEAMTVFPIFSFNMIPGLTIGCLVSNLINPDNLGPVDFFGRKMIECIDEKYRIGVINVSVAGAKIELWDKDDYKEYIDNERDWMKNIVNQYDGNPYKRLVDMARIAQKDGVIKGILIHQGESNSDDPKWPERVKKIYDNLCKDLNLNPKDVPLLAGELKHQEQGGVCWKFNVDILPNLPKTLPNSYIISAKDCESTGDQFHFSTEGMRTLGYRYAEQMLKLHKYKRR